MKKLVLLIIILSFVSCKLLLLKTYKIKDPKLEDFTSIKTFLKTKKIDTSTVYVFKNLSCFKKASKQKLLSVPNAIFFNKAGNLVDYKKKTTDCNAKIDSFLNDLSSFSQLPSDESRKITDLFDLIEDQVKSVPLDNADINVFLTWSVFAGKLNDEKAFEWANLIQKAKKNGFKINYYLLNCDFQKSWNLTEKEIKDLGLK